MGSEMRWLVFVAAILIEILGFLFFVQGVIGFAKTECKAFLVAGTLMLAAGICEAIILGRNL